MHYFEYVLSGMSGVANKEEALRCLQIAEKALRDRDFEKADRFCQKARKLCLCDEVYQERAGLQRTFIQLSMQACILKFIAHTLNVGEEC